VKWL